MQITFPTQYAFSYNKRFGVNEYDDVPLGFHPRGSQYEQRYFHYNFYSENNKHSTIGNLIGCLLGLFFLGLLLYSIIEISDESKYKFKETCGDKGHSFYIYMITRLAFCFGEGLLLGFLMLCISVGIIKCCHCVGNQVYVCLGFLPYIIFFATHITFLCVGLIYTMGVMDSGACQQIMSNASFTKTPLFGILGFVFVAFDSILTLFMIVAFVFYLSIQFL
jgi:hypothetical protein